MKPLIAIVGPTASGKSALAVSLAQRFAGEVVACDSTQVYRGFDIGTAKPTLEERHGIPHHLMDLVDPAQLFTAAEYRRRAVEVLADLCRRNRLPIFTAGTGLYLRALLAGFPMLPRVPIPCARVWTPVPRGTAARICTVFCSVSIPHRRRVFLHAIVKRWFAPSKFASFRAER